MRYRVAVAVFIVCANVMIGSAGAVPPDHASAADGGIDFDRIRSLLDPTPEDIEFAHLAATESNAKKTAEEILIDTPLALLANEIHRVYPDDYATAAVSDGALSVGFKADVPDGLADQIAELELTVRYEVNLGASEEAINSALIDVFHQLYELPGVVDASGGYDVNELSLNFGVIAEPGYTAESLEARLTVPAPYSVTIELTSESLGEDDSIIGGGRFENTGSDTGRCTSGFTILKGNAHGVASAGHCSNSPTTYEDWDGQPEEAIGVRDVQHMGDLGDMQYWLFSNTSADNFYRNSAHDVNDVIDILDPVNGITICRYGWKTGLQCDEVYAQNHCKTADDADGTAYTICGLTMMNNREADGGDSGGPWFVGGHAYGFHQGGKKLPVIVGPNRDVLTPAPNFNLAFGGTIRTS